MQVGTYGAISVRETALGRHRARTRFRDFDGVVRYVVRFGPSKTAAERALKGALVERQHTAGDGLIRSDMRVRELAALWLVQVEDSDRAPSTKARYASMVRAYIDPGVGSLTLREATVGVVERFVNTVREKHGYATAKTCRACLSSMFGLAVRHDVLKANPCASLSDIRSPTTPVRALTPAETGTLLAALRADDLAVAHDLPDLVAFMLATGVRVGEALAVLPDQVDLDAGTVEIRATVTDQGRQEKTKTDAGHRVLALPPPAVDMLRRRIADESIATSVALFPSPRGRLRDTSNTAAHLRRAFDRAGFPWLRSHSLRKTVATRLDDAGLSARQIADQLGHARPSITQDVYMGRRVTNADAARVLDTPDLFSGSKRAPRP